MEQFERKFFKEFFLTDEKEKNACILQAFLNMYFFDSLCDNFFLFLNVGFTVEMAVEFSVCLQHIRHNHKGQKTAGQSAEQEPADIAEIQAEELPFVALHHFLRAFHSFSRSHFGMIAENVEGQGIRECLDDTGDNEEEHPKKCEQYNKQICKERINKILRAIQKLSNTCIFFSCDRKIHGSATDCKRPCDHKRTKRNNGSNRSDNQVQKVRQNRDAPVTRET